MPVFSVRTRIAASAADVFAWHERPGAFERLVPPWEPIRVVERRGGIEDGARTVLEMRAGPFSVRWVAVHSGYVKDREFCDEQQEGPFRRWRHTHRVLPELDGSCTLVDDIEYELPFRALGRLADPVAIRPRLVRTFRYRHAVTVADVELHGRLARAGRLRVAITGASGLIGSSLVPMLTTGGHDVVRLARPSGGDRAPSGHAVWDPARGVLDRHALQGIDAVVHLAGANLGEHRWSASFKRTIADSRIGPTRRLAEQLASLPSPPRTLVCASGIGYYGDRPGETLTEGSQPGRGFLADLGRAWEDAARPAVEAGIRVAWMRFGIVMSPAGGALARLLVPFRLGVGGRLGSGRADLSWISVDDAAGSICHALCTSGVRGPVNATAPEPVSNAEFVRTLARVLRRPAVLPMPAAALRLAVGEMTDEALLASARVMPARLEESGFVFRHRTLEQALRHVLGR